MTTEIPPAQAGGVLGRGGSRHDRPVPPGISRRSRATRCSRAREQLVEAGGDAKQRRAVLAQFVADWGDVGAVANHDVRRCHAAGELRHASKGTTRFWASMASPRSSANSTMRRHASTTSIRIALNLRATSRRSGRARPNATASCAIPSATPICPTHCETKRLRAPKTRCRAVKR